MLCSKTGRFFKKIFNLLFLLDFLTGTQPALGKTHSIHGQPWCSDKPRG